jgi:hypothetical protein
MMEDLLDSPLTSLADHLNEQYGERGTPTREEFEEGFEAFKLGAVNQELLKRESYIPNAFSRKV